MNKSSLNLSKIVVISPQARKQFEKDLENEDQLYNFLKSLENEYPKQIVEEFVYIAYLVWEKYVQVRKASMNQSELEKIGKEFAEEVA